MVVPTEALWRVPPRKEQTMKQYAYVRISTVQQNTDRQTMALGGFDIPEEQIFIEKEV